MEAKRKRYALRPNDQGNRRAATDARQVESMNRRVRFTVGLGPGAHNGARNGRKPQHGVIADAAIGLPERSALLEWQARQVSVTRRRNGARANGARSHKG